MQTRVKHTNLRLQLFACHCISMCLVARVCSSPDKMYLQEEFGLPFSVFMLFIHHAFKYLLPKLRVCMHVVRPRKVVRIVIFSFRLLLAELMLQYYPHCSFDGAEAVAPVKQNLQTNRGKRNPYTMLLGLRRIPHQPGAKYAACCR